MRVFSQDMARLGGALAAGLMAAAGSTAQAEPSLADAIGAGKPLVDVRLRLELVEQDGLSKDADALTLRARLGYETGLYYGFKVLFDTDLLADLAGDYNDTINGKTTRPIVADPHAVELNRLQISYAGLDKTVFTVGRQRIIFDNARWVGNVGWRQNEQTFDAALVKTDLIPDLTVAYAYVNQVNRVFGPRADGVVATRGKLHGDTHLLNAAFVGFAPVKLKAYAYLVDIEDAPLGLKNQSTKTFGVRAEAPFTLAEGLKSNVVGEYARQMDYSANTLDYGVNYWLGEASLSYIGITGLVGYEVLGSDGTAALSTPLATLHAFNGWADAFLTTPAKGLEDAYLKASYTLTDLPIVTKAVATVVYHEFESEEGDTDFGDEIDASLDFTPNTYLSFGLKYAAYDGEAGIAGRDKAWFSVTVTY